MFGHRVTLRLPQRRERGSTVVTEDERNEVYTDLSTLLALAETVVDQPLDASYPTSTVGYGGHHERRVSGTAGTP
jgi:hypothetical protein